MRVRRRSQRVSRSQRLTSADSRFSERNSRLIRPTIRARQNAKIRELRDALAAAGLRALDKQAEALALSRSTTWNLLNGKHKGSGLSARIITRMVAAPRLPPLVRAKILEYVTEKAAGLYGDSAVRLRKFTAQLSLTAVRDARASGSKRRKRSKTRRVADEAPGSSVSQRRRAPS